MEERKDKQKARRGGEFYYYFEQLNCELGVGARGPAIKMKCMHVSYMVKTTEHLRWCINMANKLFCMYQDSP